MDEPCTGYFIADRAELLDAVDLARPDQRPSMLRTLRDLAVWGPRTPGAVHRPWLSADDPSDYTLAFGDEFEVWLRVDELRCEMWVVMVLRRA